MPDPTDFEEFPVFGDNSSKEKPGDQKYAAGFLPGDVLPAEWLNWFLNVISIGYNQLVNNAVGFSPDSINILTNKTIAYTDNTLTGVQPTLSAGTGINIDGTTISAKQTYSTSEVKTGDVWIDGKPIYRKVWRGNLNDQGSYMIFGGDVTGMNIDTYVKAECTLTTSSEIRFGAFATNTKYMYLYKSGNYIITETSTNYSTSDVSTIILYYTKTTD